jgi:hypothetical protein
VLGQRDLTANNPGTGSAELDWPIGAAAAGGKVVVADSYNDRILIWNTFPTQNGQAADLALSRGSASGCATSTTGICWPWGVWTDGTRLAVSST